VPISLVDENMKRAEHRDATSNQKFYFRSNPDENTPKIRELTINEVINGGKGFFGLIPYVQRFLDDTATDIDTRMHIQKYLDLISMRASGELKTTAQWMRAFVLSHPEYESDSLVSDSILSDLTHRVDKVVKGTVSDSTLHPPSAFNPSHG